MSGPFAGSGSAEAANVLSFGAAIVGFGLGWSSLAADYSVHLPENVSGWKVFWLTYAGLNLPCILIECLGAAAATVTREDWQQEYATPFPDDFLADLLSDKVRRRWCRWPPCGDSKSRRRIWQVLDSPARIEYCWQQHSQHGTLFYFFLHKSLFLPPTLIVCSIPLL